MSSYLFCHECLSKVPSNGKFEETDDGKELINQACHKFKWAVALLMVFVYIKVVSTFGKFKDKK